MKIDAYGSSEVGEVDWHSNGAAVLTRSVPHPKLLQNLGTCLTALSSTS